MPGPLDRMLGALRPAPTLDDRLPGIQAESPERAEVLADALQEGVLWTDREGRVETANEAACRILGASHGEGACDLVGQTVLEATHLKSVADLEARVRAGEGRGEITARTVGAVERGLRVRAVPLPDGGALVLLEDETELCRLRTVRTEFVANVSHELRTPLASIRATAETLQGGAASDPEIAGRFLETIIRETERLVRLSEDLLDLSRAESTGRERTRFDLGTLITDVAARLRAHADKREVTVHLVEPLSAWVEADHEEISQVLFNLLDNAIKYTPSGGQVTVDRQIRNGMVAVTVTDTGIGILSQDLPRIFERFWRADRARRFRAGEVAGGTSGTGLGLSIVKHIVEAHGGAVTAESELNRGSRFTFTLSLPSDPRQDL